MALWIGFDVGGQSVKAVLVDDQGLIIAQARRATGPQTGIPQLENLLVGIVDEFGAHGDAENVVGVGIAGCIGADGVVGGSPNLPKLAGERLDARLGAALGCSVAVDNDAHCHALAEGWTGAATGLDDFLLVALGSGVGSGLVLGGELYRGTSGFGCELGHMIVVAAGRRCGCGNLGCLEAYVSEVATRSLLAEAGEGLQHAVEGLVEQRAYGYAQALFSLAATGQVEAEGLVASMLEILGVGLGSAINTLDVATIVIGGGIAPAVMARIDEVSSAMARVLFARSVTQARLLAASGGADAGAVGAARLAMLSR